MRPKRWSRAGFLGTTEQLDEVIARDALVLARLAVDHAQIADALERLLSHAFAASRERIANADIEFATALRSSGQTGVYGLAILPLGATLDELETQLRDEAPLPADRGVAVGDHDVFLQVHLGYQYCPFTNLRLPWSDDEPAQRFIRRVIGGAAYLSVPLDRELPCCGTHAYRNANLEFLIVHRPTREWLRGSGLLAHLIRDHQFFEGVQSPFRIDPERAARVLQIASGSGVATVTVSAS